MNKTIAALLLCGLATQASANLISNGDFESGGADWAAFGEGSFTVVERSDEAGNHAALLNVSDSTGFTVMYQPFFIPPGVTEVDVSFDFMFSERDRASGESFLLSQTDIFASALNLSWGGGLLDLLQTNLTVYETSTTDGWVNFSATFGVTGYEDNDPNAWLVFMLGESSGLFRDLTDSYAMIDDVVVTATAAVPEPSSLALVGAGLLALGFARRRAAK